MTRFLRAMRFIMFISGVAAAPSYAHHTEYDGCPDTHINSGESIEYEVTVRDTGQPVYDGMVLPTYTILRFHGRAAAYGQCEIYWPSANGCYLGVTKYRYVGKINFKLFAEAGPLQGWQVNPGPVYALKPNGQTSTTHNVIDSHDADTTGPSQHSLSYAGKYTYHTYNVTLGTICEIEPDTIEATPITVYAHNFATDEDLGCGKDAVVGNPCHVKTGNKYQREVDTNGDVLPIVRHYNSLFTGVDYGMGRGWLSPYLRRLEVYPTATGAEAHYRRGDGYGEPFIRTGTTWAAETDSTSTLVEDSTGYTVTYATRSRDRFDRDGRLMESTDDAGTTVSLSYGTNGRVAVVTDAFGNELLFSYNADRRVTSIDRGGAIHSFAYDAITGNLTQITYPDGTTREYLYENTSFANHLTGLIDEAGVRWGTYTYDSNGRATASQHPGGAGDVTLAYTNSTSTVVTDALGIARTFTHSKIKGAYRVTGVSASSCAWCKPTKATTYDTNANATSRTDWLNRKTCYAYDGSRNLETIRLEGLAAGVNCPSNLTTYTPTAGTRQRKISTQWHSTLPFPVHIDEPGRRTTYSYDAAGNELTRTVLDTSTSESRTWTNTFDSAHRLLTADGPRTDVSDVTTYSYYSCTSGSRCGQLHTITNALGHVTTYNSYNAQGQPLSITDANGLVTTLTYDLRKRLASSTVGGEQTLFQYWPTGKLKKVTKPDGSYYSYTYDNAHRLTGIVDSAGNTVAYTLDAMGNRTSEQMRDASSTLARTRTAVFDSANRLWKLVGAAGTSAVTTTYGYDNEGNVTSVADPMSRSTTQTYDELNRLTQSTDPLSGTTLQGYNALDQLTSVTDPRGKVTSYAHNALGDLLQLVSPDTGSTNMTYDSGGNLATNTDARSKAGTFSYDALNRLTSASYADQTINYTYDGGTNQKSHLTQVTDNSGTTSWTFNSRGRITSRQQTMGVTKTVGYAYDSNGRLQTLTLPSGNVVNFGYTDGEVTSLSLNGATTILSDVLYQPFGPTRGWIWGNTTIVSREYDTDGNVTDIDSAGLTTYAYDDAFRLTAIADASNSALSQAYGYDQLDRLTSASSGSSNQTWTYDASGNRLTQDGSSASTYTVASSSNRLSSVSGALSRTYSYDNAGHATGDGTATFVYNDAGRMTSATKASVTTTYAVNALGERVKKTTAGTTRYFVYDDKRHLVGEYSGSGALIQEIIWLGDIPVATIRLNGAGVSVYYIHTDHLNTPRRITRPSDNVIVWRWDSDPFGTSAANEDPDGDSTQIELQLRFAGQYFDSETGLHYNQFRDYDSATGRYIQSDPIGLGGGINTFSYVGGSPVTDVDPLGLCKKCGLAKAPEYDHQGTVPRNTRFSWSAEFRNDGDYDPKCCEVHQEVQWDRSPHGKDRRGPHDGFDRFNEYEPHTWYEDRDVDDWRYGYRTGPYAQPTTNNSYTGNRYYGDDQPRSQNPIYGYHMLFQLKVLDVCNGSSVIYTSNVLTVDFGL